MSTIHKQLSGLESNAIHLSQVQNALTAVFRLKRMIRECAVGKEENERVVGKPGQITGFLSTYLLMRSDMFSV